MKFLEALNKLKPFAGVAAALVPGGPAVLAAVNLVLGANEQLSDGSTISDIDTAVANMQPEQKASLLEKEIDFKIAQEEGWTERYTTMAKVDGQSTRPKIAMIMAYLLTTESLGLMAFLYLNPTAVSDSNTWTVFAALTAVPAGVLGKYFGDLKREQHARIGYNQTSLVSGIKNLFNR